MMCIVVVAQCAQVYPPELNFTAEV